ncbi:MAG: glucose 1-dehydrogenase [Chloroflexi bacterium]|nr:glucose 1-dehydrogenase [Chloroflexota bacterium]
MADTGVLVGKVALVTGAGRGIGRAIALALAHAGADVAASDINAQTAEDTAAEVRGLGQRALALAGDVAGKSDVQHWVDETVARLGQLDVLVSNAGWRPRHPFLEFPEDVWDRIMAVCLKGVFLCGQAAAREMVKRGGGRIINISSVVADRAFVNTAAYSAAKGGINALTYVMATELAPYGVTVNAIAPGLVMTPHQAEHTSPEAWRQRLRRTPLGRAAQPDEVAPLAVYLASDAAAWVTGSVFRIDGGFSAGGVFPEPTL